MVAQFEEFRSKSGRLIHKVTRAQLERQPGFRARANKARCVCPFHEGADNPTALDIDFTKGTATCRTHDCYAVIVDEADLLPFRGRSRSRAPRDISPPPAHVAVSRADPSPAVLESLQRSCQRAQEAFPASPGAAYVAARGIPVDLAQRYGLGWSTRFGVGKLIGHHPLLFPLSDPSGVITSVSGRTLESDRTPKYLVLPEREGYEKGWFNAGAIRTARETGLPVYLTEGPFDTLALLAGGIDTAAAIMGKRDPRLVRWLAQWVSGVSTVILCPDEDASGREGFATILRELSLVVAAPRMAPAGYLQGCKDLSEFWQTHRRLPDALLEVTEAPQVLTPTTERDFPAPDDLGDLYERPGALTEERWNALIDLGWHPTGLPECSLAEAEDRARQGLPYNVKASPRVLTDPADLPSSCIAARACAYLGACDRVPYCDRGVNGGQ